jgi:tetratricopeptide (TPR) repeat protein
MAKKLKRTGKKMVPGKILEEPRSIAALERVTNLFTENWRLFVIGFVLLGLVVVAVLWWMRSLEQKELVASFSLSQGVAKLKEADDLSGEEATTAYNEALNIFDNLVEESGSTESGGLAMFYGGKCLSRLKRYGEAAKKYEGFLSIAGKNRLYRSLALRNLGFAYQNEKDYEKALAAFEKLAEMEEGFLRGESTLALAQVYEKMGRSQEALETYRHFLKEHPNSTESNRIAQRVAFLEKQVQ